MPGQTFPARTSTIVTRFGVALGAAISATTAIIVAPATAHACEPTTMPYVRYDPTPAAVDAVLEAGLWPEVSGYYHNSWIALQSPNAGTRLCKGDTVLLRTNRQTVPELDPESPTP